MSSRDDVAAEDQPGRTGQSLPVRGTERTVTNRSASIFRGTERTVTNRSAGIFRGTERTVTNRSASILGRNKRKLIFGAGLWYVEAWGVSFATWEGLPHE